MQLEEWVQRQIVNQRGLGSDLFVRHKYSDFTGYIDTLFGIVNEELIHRVCMHISDIGMERRGLWHLG